jgi:hypothetical protein
MIAESSFVRTGAVTRFSARLYGAAHESAIMFSLEDPGSAEDLHRARAVHGEDSDLQAIDKERFLLLVRGDLARGCRELEEAA